MDGSLIITGIALLVLLAMAVGVLRAEERASRDIARSRRHNWEERRRTQELLEAMEKCRDCPFRSRKHDRDREPGT